MKQINALSEYLLTEKNYRKGLQSININIVILF